MICSFPQEEEGGARGRERRQCQKGSDKDFAACFFLFSQGILTQNNNDSSHAGTLVSVEMDQNWILLRGEGGDLD